MITWIDGDFDDDAQISLYYGEDTVFTNSAVIPGAQGLSEDDPNNYFNWNTSSLDSGDVFYVFAKITDNLHPSEVSRSSGTVFIRHDPTPNTAPYIQIIQPDGIGDVCDQNFLITWADSDPDDDALIWLCYAEDNQGTGETLIVGADSISENDDLDSYFWDTSQRPDGESYYIKAYILDSVNQSDYSISSGPVTIDHSLSSVPPEAPSNLTSVTLSSTEISLSWMDNSANEAGFKVERRTETGSFQLIAQTAADVNSYSDDGLTPASIYYYRVKAFNAAGESAYSNVDTGSTSQPVPQAPSGLAVTAISTSELHLDWDDNSSDETGFIIERRSGGSGAFSRIDSVGIDTSQFTDSGLQAGSLYQYRIAAYNEGGVSAYSNIEGAQTIEHLPDPPANLNAVTQSAFSISLTWSDNSNNEDGFKIERSQAFAGPYSVVYTAVYNTQYYLDQNLTPAASYYYRVTAYNSAGQSGYSNIDSSLTTSYDPATPQNLHVTSTSPYSVSIAWDDLSNNEDGFIVERAQGASGSFSQIGSTNTNVNFYTDSQCYPLTLYKYRVKAFNAYAESGYSNVAEITTPEASPFDLELVPAGIFTMGNEPYGYGNEFHPGNPVVVPGIELMINPVTNYEYSQFLNDMYLANAIVIYNGDVYSADTSEFYIATSSSECQIDFSGSSFTAQTVYMEYPVMLVSWYGANAFAEFFGMQLPTEAMWEKSARGTYGPDSNGDGVGDGYKYPWGNSIDGTYTNYNNSGDPWEAGSWPLTSPVGAYDGTNYGGFQTNDNSSIYEIYDLCGNVWEWCQDWYGPYQDPHDPPASGTHKVVRGGSWSSSTYFCRNGYRNFYAPDTRYNNVGFRCVRLE